MEDLSAITISELIGSAQRGSLFHSCIEKIAYKLHLDHPERDANSNWFEAQAYFGCWANVNFRFCDSRDLPVFSFFEGYINSGKKAYGDDVDLLYKLGERIVDSVDGKFFSILRSAA